MKQSSGNWLGTRASFGLSLMAINLWVLVGCSTPRLLPPVPEGSSQQAQIPGFPNVRGFALSPSRVFQESIIQAGQEQLNGGESLEGIDEMAILSLSGGGPNGSFSAGFLKGWTQSGERPTFDLVTGVSTGALIAPFAFLGSEYDDVLEDLYTRNSSKRLFRPLPVWRIWQSNAIYDARSLRVLIANAVDEEVLFAIGSAHRRGRRLFMLTTNMDVGRAVVWDMGKIASSADPGALALFHKVMLASSSIPLAYPPVYFDVEVNGQLYGEMHLDGGVAAQVFLFGVLTDLREVRAALGYSQWEGPATAYVLRNGVARTGWLHTVADLSSIGLRTVSIATNSMALGDLLRIHELCRQNSLAFRMAVSPEDLAPDGGVDFDEEEMRHLFELGRELGSSQAPWMKHPFEMLAEAPAQ